MFECSIVFICFSCIVRVIQDVLFSCLGDLSPCSAAEDTQTLSSAIT